jgi:hypothetical protein
MTFRPRHSQDAARPGYYGKSKRGEDAVAGPPFSAMARVESRTKITVRDVQKLLNSAAGMVATHGRKVSARPLAMRATARAA